MAPFNGAYIDVSEPELAHITLAVSYHGQVDLAVSYHRQVDLAVSYHRQVDLARTMLGVISGFINLLFISFFLSFFLSFLLNMHTLHFSPSFPTLFHISFYYTTKIALNREEGWRVKVGEEGWKVNVGEEGWKVKVIKCTTVSW